MSQIPDLQPRESGAAKNDVFAQIRGWAPAEVLEFLDQVMFLFPDDFKHRIKQVIDSLPAEADNLDKVLELVRRQWEDLQSDEHFQIAVAGLPRAGKSSLVRMITANQASGADPIFVPVNLPGLPEFVGYEPAQSLPPELQEVDMVLLVLDGRFELSESTRDLYRRLQNCGKPLLVVLNKIDLTERPGEALKEAKRLLGTTVFPASIQKPGTVRRLLKAIVASDPKSLYVLTRNLPDFRRSICDAAITQSALASGIVGAIPIPVSDLLPVAAIQTAMLLKIAKAFGYPLSHERARELLPLLASGVVVREGGYRLRQKFPRQGRLISVSVGGGWTFLVGQLIVRYFEQLSRLTEKRGAVVVPMR